MENSDEINLKSLALYFKKQLPFIIIIPILALVAGFVRVQLARTTVAYSASSEVLMDGYSSNAGLTSTFDSIVKSDDFKQNVAKRVQATAENDSASNSDDIKLTVAATVGASVYTLTATSSNDNAIAIANAAAEEFVSYANTMNLTETLIEKEGAKITFGVLQKASETKTVESGPELKKTLLIFGLAGLVLALAIVVICYLVDDRIRSRADLKSNHKLLGEIHFDGKEINDAEILTAKISAILGDKKIVSIMSPTANLTDQLAQNITTAYDCIGKTALYIDADYHNKNSTSEGEGLAEALAKPDKVASFILKDDDAKDSPKHELPRGEFDSDLIGALLQNDNLSTILKKLSDDYDVIVINAGHIIGHADALALARISDVNLLFATLNKTRGRQFNQAIDDLSHVKVTPDGIILGEVI